MAAISWRGIMMSLTLTRSRSRIDSSICRWRCGTSVLASATTVRSSSVDSACGACVRAGDPEQTQEALRDRGSLTQTDRRR